MTENPFAEGSGAGAPSVEMRRARGLTGVALLLFVAAAVSAYTLVSDTVESPGADRVLGQPSFTSVAAGSGAGQMNAPSDVVLDDSGVVYVADAQNDRVLVFRDLADTLPDTTIGGVLNQVGADRLDRPVGLAVWHGAETTVLFVSDENNHRVLGFIVRRPGTAAVLGDTVADYVFGQPAFDTNVEANDGTGASSPSARGLAAPRGLFALDSGGASISLYVADHDHHRVLRYDVAKRLFGSPNASMDTPADAVYGQSSFAGAFGATAADRLDDPTDVWATAGRLWIAEEGSHRVVVESTGDTTWDAVYGQPNLASSAFGFSATELNAPQAVAVSPDGTTLAIADGNDRVLLHAETSGAETVPDDVVGDSDLLPAAFSSADSRGLAGPEGLWFEGRDRLWIADAGHHRVLRFDAAAVPAVSGVTLQAVVQATSSAATVVSVSAAPGESFVQVNLSGGGTTPAASLPTAPNAAGTLADYTLVVPFTAGAETATVYLWTSLETSAVLLGRRSDTTSLDPDVLPRGLRDGSETAFRALLATALLVEFADSAGRLVGTTSTTTDVSESFAYAIRYDLSETTTARLASLGLDTRPISVAFRYWFADSWTGVWSQTGADVEVLAGGRTMTLVAVGLRTDLPGAMGGANPTSVEALGGGGGACLLETVFSRVPAWSRGLLPRLRAWRDRLLASTAGRGLTALYYVVSAR